MAMKSETIRKPSPTGPVILLATLLTLTGCHLVPFNRQNGRESHALVLNREGIAAFERENLPEAEEKFAQAIKNDENDLKSRRYYAETLWRQGKKKEALHYLVDASTREGSEEEKGEIYLSLGEKFLEMNQTTVAANYANKVININAKRHEGWELRGEIFRRLGKSEEALADYHRALCLAPGDQTLLRSLATLEDETGDFDASLATWQELGRFYPDHGEPIDVLCGKALACRHLNRSREAADYYALAIDQDPENAHLYSLLAETYLESDDVENARIIASKATERFPSDPNFLSLRERVEKLATTPDGKRKY